MGLDMVDILHHTTDSEDMAVVCTEELVVWVWEEWEWDMGVMVGSEQTQMTQIA